MSKRGRVFFQDRLAGVIQEDSEGFRFEYDDAYLAMPDAQAISRTLPLRHEPFCSQTMFPFFDGLIPEGWLLDIAMENWKINSRDRMSLLLACCKDCIGAVRVEPMTEEEYE